MLSNVIYMPRAIHTLQPDTEKLGRAQAPLTWGMSSRHAPSRAQHPEGFCQHLSEHPHCNTLFRYLSVALAASSKVFFPDTHGRICLSDTLERIWEVQMILA